MHIMKTNYYAYLIGRSCTELPDDQHELSWFVWTRDKKPAFYWRREVRDYLLKEQNVDVGSLEKGQIKECWGDDKS